MSEPPHEKVNLSSDKKRKDISKLFQDLNAIKSIGIKNLIFMSIMVTIFIVIILVDLYVMFYLTDEPFLYGVYVWVQHGTHLSFYLMVFILPCIMKNYRKEFNVKLSMFEKEANCRIRIIDRVRLFEVNWEPRKFKKKNSKGKEFAKLIKEQSSGSYEEIEDNDKKMVKKVEVGKKKPKIASNKVKPL